MWLNLTLKSVFLLHCLSCLPPTLIVILSTNKEVKINILLGGQRCLLYNYEYQLFMRRKSQPLFNMQTAFGAIAHFWISAPFHLDTVKNSSVLSVPIANWVIYDHKRSQSYEEKKGIAGKRKNKPTICLGRNGQLQGKGHFL